MNNSNKFRKESSNFKQDIISQYTEEDADIELNFDEMYELEGLEG